MSEAREVSSPTPTSEAAPAVVWRHVLLPVEHGGWGFLLEPLLLGLLVTSSFSGVLLSVAAVAAFLIRHPLKLALGDRQRGRRYPRTRAAEAGVALWTVLAGSALAGAVVLGRPSLVWPIALAAPLALVQLVFDLRGRGRELAPELLGGVALAAGAPAVLLAAEAPPMTAGAVWLLLALRAVTAVLYVRVRLRLARGVEASRVPPLALHAAATGLVAAIALTRLLPWLSVLAFGILTVRALHGLGPRPPVPPRVVGMQEMVFGLVTTFLTAAGLRLGL